MSLARLAECQRSNRTWTKYFVENMEATGAPAPTTVWTSATTILATAQTILNAADTYGSRVTLREVVSATSNLEKLKITGAIMASAYAGVMISSAAVATGRYLGCGTTMSEVLFGARMHGVYRDWMPEFFMRNPEILEPRYPARFIVYQRNALAEKTS